MGVLLWNGRIVLKSHEIVSSPAPTKPFKLKAFIPSEDQEAQSLIEYATWRKWRGIRLSEVLVMIPNGAYLGGDPRQRAMTMGKLKRAGLRPGVYDYLLAVPTPKYPGLWLELKRQKLGVTSPEQVRFGELMAWLGWKCVVVKGWEQGKEAIEAHLATIKGVT